MELNVDGLPSTVMPLPAATLTFDLLNRKPNQYVSCLRYIRDLILVKLARIRKYCIHTIFCVIGSLPAVTLIFDLLTQSHQHIYEPKCIRDQNRVKFPSFFRYGIHKVFGTHRFTHSLSHSRTDRPAVPFFNGGEG